MMMVRSDDGMVDRRMQRQEEQHGHHHHQHQQSIINSPSHSPVLDHPSRRRVWMVSMERMDGWTRWTVHALLLSSLPIQHRQVDGLMLICQSSYQCPSLS